LYEETGLKARPIGITGVYYNTTSHILSLVFDNKGVIPYFVRKTKLINLMDDDD